MDKNQFELKYLHILLYDDMEKKTYRKKLMFFHLLNSPFPSIKTFLLSFSNKPVTKSTTAREKCSGITGVSH